MRLPIARNTAIRRDGSLRRVLFAALLCSPFLSANSHAASGCGGVKFQIENALSSTVDIRDLTVVNGNDRQRERLSKQTLDAGTTYTTNKRTLDSVGVGQKVDLVLRYAVRGNGKEDRTVRVSRVCERNMTWRIELK